MAIVIKEIQVKTTIEKKISTPVFSSEAIRKLKQEILMELRNSAVKQNRKGKDR